MATKSSPEVIVGSDNVFDDLGFEAEEAMNLKVRADLMIDLCNHIESQGWNLQEAAKRLGRPLPEINGLVEGDIEQFSVDKLIGLLGKVGKQVKVEVVL